MKKQSITLNRPLYVGFSVLDISKLIMYRFHYGFILTTYGSRARLCMTDTDSLLYDIQTDDVYKDIQKRLDLFDTSDYPTTHPCHSNINMKKLGTFKDETKSIPILEFVGLRAKCYSFVTLNDKEKKVAKGVPRSAIKNQLKHQQYKQCLKRHGVKSTRLRRLFAVNNTTYIQNRSSNNLCRRSMINVIYWMMVKELWLTVIIELELNNPESPL